MQNRQYSLRFPALRRPGHFGDTGLEDVKAVNRDCVSSGISDKMTPGQVYQVGLRSQFRQDFFPDTAEQIDAAEKILTLSRIQS